MVTDDGNDVQAQMAAWIKTELNKKAKSANWLAREIGVDASAMSRALALQRGMSIKEVALVAQALGKAPPPWNKIRRQYEGSSLMPLMGRVNAQVWSVKGRSDMAKGLAPIERVLAENDDGDEQIAYYIESGEGAGQYAICCRPSKTEPATPTDLLIVEETTTVQGADFQRLTIRTLSSSENNELVAWGEDDLPPAILGKAKIEAKILWFLTPVRKGHSLLDSVL